MLFIVTASDFPSAHRLQPRSRRFRRSAGRGVERRVPDHPTTGTPAFCLPGAFNPALLYIPVQQRQHEATCLRGNWVPWRRNRGMQLWMERPESCSGCGCLYPPISRGYFAAFMLARMAEEVGELAREVNHRYGESRRNPMKPRVKSRWSWGISCLSSSVCQLHGHRSGRGFHRVMHKYNTRMPIGGPGWIEKGEKGGSVSAAQPECIDRN